MIPHPLGTTPRRIEVLASSPPPDEQFGGIASQGRTCASYFERSAILADAVTVVSPRWLSWAVSEALANRVPRTRAYLYPSLTGAKGVDLGRGPLDLPMVFTGPTCWPRWPDGSMCDDPDPSRPPEHEAFFPRRRVVVEDVGDVVFEEYEAARWPSYRAPGGVA